MGRDASERGGGERSSAAELSAELRIAITRVHSRLRSERDGGEHELGEGAGYVLALLVEHGPLSLKALSGRAHVTPAAMSQTVKRLIAGDLARREIDPEDRRKVLISATAAGRDLARARRRRGGGWLGQTLVALTPYERVVLHEASALLKRIADA